MLLASRLLVADGELTALQLLRACMPVLPKRVSRALQQRMDPVVGPSPRQLLCLALSSLQGQAGERLQENGRLPATLRLVCLQAPVHEACSCAAAS